MPRQFCIVPQQFQQREIYTLHSVVLPILCRLSLDTFSLSYFISQNIPLPPSLIDLLWHKLLFLLLMHSFLKASSNFQYYICAQAQPIHPKDKIVADISQNGDLWYNPKKSQIYSFDLLWNEFGYPSQENGDITKRIRNFWPKWVVVIWDLLKFY